MLRAILFGCILSCTAFSPVISLTYAEEVVVEDENFLQGKKPPAFPIDESAPHAQVTDVRALFFKTLLMLGGLCGLVIAGGYFFKRLSGGKLSSFSSNGAIDLVERKYLSPKTSVWLIEVHGQPLVVVDSLYGVAIHSLKEMPSEENLSPPHFS